MVGTATLHAAVNRPQLPPACLSLLIYKINIGDAKTTKDLNVSVPRSGFTPKIKVVISGFRVELNPYPKP